MRQKLLLRYTILLSAFILISIATSVIFAGKAEAANIYGGTEYNQSPSGLQTCPGTCPQAPGSTCNNGPGANNSGGCGKLNPVAEGIEKTKWSS